MLDGTGGGCGPYPFTEPTAAASALDVDPVIASSVELLHGFGEALGRKDAETAPEVFAKDPAPTPGWRSGLRSIGPCFPCLSQPTTTPFGISGMIPLPCYAQTMSMAWRLSVIRITSKSRGGLQSGCTFFVAWWTVMGSRGRWCGFRSSLLAQFPGVGVQAAHHAEPG